MKPKKSTPIVEETPTAPALAWRPMPERLSRPEAARNAMLAIALILLAAACITAFYAALRITSIWFETRFVPIAQLVVAGLVIALCVVVVRRIKAE